MPQQLARERSATLLFYGCVLLLGYLLYQLFEPFLRPLAWAAIFAAFFHRWHKRFEQRYGRSPAASLSTAAVTLIIVVPFVLLMAFIQEATETLTSADLMGNSSKGLRPGAARLELDAASAVWQGYPRPGGGAQQASARIAQTVAEGAGILLRNLVVLIVNVIIMLFALFFFFRDGDAIMARLRRVLPFDASFREGRIRETAELIRASISSGVIVALVQGAVGGLTFAVLGLGAPVFWGVIMAFFSLLPLGAWIVWMPVSVWLLLTGEIGRGITLMVVGAARHQHDRQFSPPHLAERTDADEWASGVHQPPGRHCRIRFDWTRAGTCHHGNGDQLRRRLRDRATRGDSH